MLFLLIGLIALTEACSVFERINCTVAMINCDFICEFAIMHPKYNDECMACVMTTVKRCCNYLFPNWTYCNTTLVTWENKYYSQPRGNIRATLCNNTYCTYRTDD